MILWTILLFIIAVYLTVSFFTFLMTLWATIRNPDGILYSVYVSLITSLIWPYLVIVVWLLFPDPEDHD
jgi:hypothetical protein